MPEQFEVMNFQQYVYYATGVQRRSDKISGDMRNIWALLYDVNVAKASDRISHKPNVLNSVWPLSTDKITAAPLDDPEAIKARFRQQWELSIKHGTATWQTTNG